MYTYIEHKFQQQLKAKQVARGPAEWSACSMSDGSMTEISWLWRPSKA